MKASRSQIVAAARFLNHLSLTDRRLSLGLLMVLGNGAGIVPGKLVRTVPEHTGAVCGAVSGGTLACCGAVLQYRWWAESGGLKGVG